MQDEQMYEFSTKTNRIITIAKNLLKLHLIRYKHLVDSGPRGFNCTYAKITKRHFCESKEEELEVLKNLKKYIEGVIDEIENSF